MTRSRKDSFNQLPVEQYRKQIGKQDYKKTKAELKESKQKSDLTKQGYGEQYKELSLMMLALIVMVVSVYLLFYLYLANSPTQDKQPG